LEAERGNLLAKRPQQALNVSQAVTDTETSGQMDKGIPEGRPLSSPKMHFFFSSQRDIFNVLVEDVIGLSGLREVI